jgi:DNA-binding response OmpR family regulator
MQGSAAATKDTMKKILIVDDNKDIRRLIRMTLEMEDVEIIEACDGESGLARTVEELPDVVLLDIMMPGGTDGIEACRRIKADARLSAARVVILSARGSAEERERGMQAGADVYLVKPFSPLQLLQVVTTMAFAPA